MLVQVVVCQVFPFIQTFLWEMTGTSDYVTLTLRLSAEKLEKSLKVHKEPAC